MSSSTYTVSDVEKADRLWDQMPLSEVSEETGVPESTLGNWSMQGLINTDTDHRQNRTTRKHSEDTLQLVEELWQVRPLTEISETLDIPYTTLHGWSQRGLISTDVEWRGTHQQEGMEKKIRRAAHFYYETDLTPQAAAEKMEVAISTFYRYIRLYRNM